MIIELFNRYLNNKKGFTLLEILLVILISGIIVLTIGYSILSSFNAYSNGEDLVQIQQDIRLVVNNLTKEIRNAEEIKLYNSLPETLGNYNYIYLENNSFKMDNSSGTKIIYTGNITSLNFQLIPINDENSNYNFYLKFSVSGNEGNSSYQIQNEKILLNNLETNTSSFNNGSVIAYKNPN